MSNDHQDFDYRYISTEYELVINRRSTVDSIILLPLLFVACDGNGWTLQLQFGTGPGRLPPYYTEYQYYKELLCLPTVVVLPTVSIVVCDLSSVLNGSR